MAGTMPEASLMFASHGGPQILIQWTGIPTGSGRMVKVWLQYYVASPVRPDAIQQQIIR